jgi:integrase
LKSGAPLTHSVYGKLFREALATAKIADFRFHDLRHTAASYLAQNGATLLEIQQVLGHRTPAMVTRYAHLTESHVEAVVDRVMRSRLK